MKKLLLLFATIFLTLPGWASIQIEYLYYNLDDSSLTAEVTSLANRYTDFYDKLTIPKNVVYNGKTYTVTSIGEEAFYGCSGLTSIEIPNSVTSIGRLAFASCRGLKSVEIPSSVTSIGVQAFYDCSSLSSINVDNENPSYESRGGILYSKNFKTLIQCPAGFSGSVTIPNSVTEIGIGAFQCCDGLRSVTIPNSVTIINNVAFNACGSLTRVIIPNSVTEIGEAAFSSCQGLTSVTIPSSVKTIGEEAFWGCRVLESIEIPNSVTYIGAEAFSDCRSIYEITIPESVTYIGRNAFFTGENLSVVRYNAIDCEFDNLEDEMYYHTFYPSYMNLEIGNKVKTIPQYFVAGNYIISSINLPNSLVSIGFGAFYQCWGLTSVTIPNSVTSIGFGAFQDCQSLESINVDNENPSYESRGGILYSKNFKTLIQCPMGFRERSVSIPNSVTEIEAAAFLDCYALESVSIGNSVTSIGAYAFQMCGLSEVTIPSSVETIGDYAFTGYKLLDLTIGCGIKEIGEFGIGNKYYSDMVNLYITALDAPKIEESDYNSDIFKANIYIPETSFDSYAKAPYFWNEFVNFKELVSPTAFTTDKLEINGQRGSRETIKVDFTPANTTLQHIWVSGYDPEIIYVEWDENLEIEVTILDGDKGTDIVIENLYADHNRIIVKVNGGGEDNPGNGGDNGGNGDDNGNGGNGGGNNAVESVDGETNLPLDIYTIQGVCLKYGASQEDIDALRPGLYIIGGKKVVVK